MSQLNSATRRHFLRHASALSALGAAGAPLALNLAAAGSAAAQTASGYKALVCIFLYGGNDPFNTVLATDSASWANYRTVRNQAPESIALMAPGVAPSSGAAAGSPARLGGVLPIAPLNSQGRTFALHPMLKSLQTMFNTDKRLAIVSNVGPLMTPTTKAQYASFTHPKPAKLFSHNDQQSTWQAFSPEGASQGWGGRMCDLLGAGSSTGATFAAVSANGKAVWLSGKTVDDYIVTPSGALMLGSNPAGSLYGARYGAQVLRRVASTSRSGHVLEADYAAVAQRSMTAEGQLRNVLKPGDDARWGTPVSGSYNGQADAKLKYTSPLTGSATYNPLAHQLQVVARMMDAGAVMGMKRQVFFVGMGGFDNHNSQNPTHADLMARLAHAMRYFDTTLANMGLREEVTTFTASDFGRTFTSNGDGTDHGWGNHHFVMGGAVRGGNIYGHFPTLAAKNRGNNGFDGSPNQLLNGVLLPEISVEQYASTLGRWFGLSGTQALEILPALNEFDSARHNLGFMI